MLLSLALWACAHHSPSPEALPPQRFAPLAESPAPDPDRRAAVLAATEALPALVEAGMRQRGIPGVSAGVVLGDELVWSAAFGLATLEPPVPMTVETVGRIGSVSKVFTGAALLLLRDRGLLRLDDAVATVVPEMEGVIYPTRDSPPVTFRHLVTHTSGFPRMGDLDYFSRPEQGVDEEELLAALQDLELVFAPGTRSEYSNLAMVVASLVVGRVSGLPARDFITQEFLAPLGMGATVWGAEEVPPDALATGYVERGAELVAAPHWQFGVAEGMGGLYSNVPDMARFAAFELSAWPPRDTPDDGPLARASLRESQLPAGGGTPGSTTFGVNWVVRADDALGHFVFHTGSTDKYSSSLFLAPAQQVAVVTFANVGDAASDPIASALLRQVVAALPQPALEVDNALLQQTSAVLALFGAPDTAAIQRLFSPMFLNAVPAEKVAGILSSLDGLGACENLGPSRSNGPWQAWFDLACTQGDVELMLAVESSGAIQITGFSVKGR